MHDSLRSLGLVAVALPMVAIAEKPLPAAVQAQLVASVGGQASLEGPSEYFIGLVRIDPVWSSDEALTASGAWVTFEPGARSAWHTHPAGQRLVVTAGVGLTQEWGKPVQEIHPGDVVTCPAGVKHWHGASATTAMTHLAVTGVLDGQNVEWMEQVSDEQYQAAR